MTKKIRNILFLGLLFLFIILAPSIIFYSWGYRLNFEAKKIVKTGAFYFKILPKSAEISLIPLVNNSEVSQEKELTKKTDFFFGAALIENLLPNRYEIEIKKEGFYSWKKTLEIKENQVTEIKNIVLIPKVAGINLIVKNVEDFFPSPDGKIIILKEINESSGTSSPASSSTGWALKTFDLNTEVKSGLMESKDILKNGEVKLLDLKFSPDSKRLLLKVSTNQHIRYYLIDLNQTPSKITQLDFLPEDLDDIFFVRDNAQKLIILEKGVIYGADLTQKKISAKILENIKSLQADGSNFYYFDNTEFLFRTDSSFSRQEKINNSPFSLEKELTYKINVFSDQIFVTDIQNLYFLNPDSGSFEKIFGTGKEPKISPDLKKIAYYSDYEIWLMFLKSELGQPPKEKGERVFIGRFSEKINQVFWFTNNYLIFTSAAKIKIAEIDDRDIINIVDLTDFNSPEIFWNQSYKKLFILSDGVFYGSKMLLP